MCRCQYELTLDSLCELDEEIFSIESFKEGDCFIISNHRSLSVTAIVLLHHIIQYRIIVCLLKFATLVVEEDDIFHHAAFLVVKSAYDGNLVGVDRNGRGKVAWLKATLRWLDQLPDLLLKVRQSFNRIQRVPLIYTFDFAPNHVDTVTEGACAWQATCHVQRRHIYPCVCGENVPLDLARLHRNSADSHNATIFVVGYG